MSENDKQSAPNSTGTTTGGSIRSEHVAACAAYIVGWPILVWVFIYFGVFGFIDNFVEVRVWDIWNEVAKLPKAMNADLKHTIAVCRLASPVCAMDGLAYHFVPLAIVGGVAIPGLFRGPPRAAAVRRGTEAWWLAHFVACLALLEGACRYVVDPLAIALLDIPPSGLDYTERWQYLTGYAFAEAAATIVAACLATGHSMRIRAGRSTGQLFEAIEAGDAGAVREHLAVGADPNAARDEDGATPLHAAAQTANSEVVWALLEKQADPKVQDNAGATPLHAAARAGDTETMHALLAAGADAKETDQSGATALHIAAHEGDEKVVITLLTEEGVLEPCDDAGATPLHVAAKAGHTTVVEDMLELGADANVRSSDGRTPLEWALAEGHSDTAAALRNAGGA